MGTPIYVYFKEAAKLSFKVAMPPVMNKSSSCSSSLPVFDVVSVLDFGDYNRCVSYISLLF